MSFWDDPSNLPRGGSWPAEGTITRMAVLDSPRYAGKISLVLELDGDNRQRWCPIRLWRALAESRVDVGDRIRVIRGPDEAPAQPGGRPIATWIVERLQKQPTGPATAPQWGSQPQGWGTGQAQPTAATGPTW